MAADHFIKHPLARERTDWNFNILFNDQPQVAAYVEQYRPLLDHSGLYQAVPSEWLHATILRVGFLEDFTEEEMLELAKRLEPKLSSLKVPELMLGQWLLYGGNPCVHFTPEDPLTEVFTAVSDEVASTLGKNRFKAPTKFTPHITLAYSKSYDDEADLFKQLESKQIKAVPVRAEQLSLIKQHVENNYYVWEIVKDIEIGQEVLSS